jgi:hypothetical protein
MSKADLMRNPKKTQFLGAGHSKWHLFIYGLVNLLLHLSSLSFASATPPASEFLSSHAEEQSLSSDDLRQDIAALQVHAQTLAHDGDFVSASDTLVNALYLLHREEGVTSKKQIPIVQQLQSLSVKQKDFRQADKLAHLQHFLGQRGNDGDLPSHQTLLDWYVNTGQYRRAQSLIEDMKDETSKSGPEVEQSMILIEARLARFHGRCCDAKALLSLIDDDITEESKSSDSLVLRTASILSQQTLEALLLESGRRDSAAIDRLAARVGDTEPYLIPSLRRVTPRSDESIRSRMLEQQIRMRYGRSQSMFEQDREFEETPLFFIVPFDGMLPVMIEDQTGLKTGPNFAAELVGEPIAFLKRKLKEELPSRYQRDAQLADLSVAMTMTIKADGKITDLEFEEGTHGQVKRLFYDVTKRLRMMPKIENGRAIASSFSLVQTFQGANFLQASEAEKAHSSSDRTTDRQSPVPDTDAQTQAADSD